MSLPLPQAVTTSATPHAIAVAAKGIANFILIISLRFVVLCDVIHTSRD
jgi:hypothetical protein